MGLKEWLIPQDKIFFDLLEKQALTALEGANKLMDMLQNPVNLEMKVKELKDIEHQGDKLIKDIFVELNKTFITPIDREDIVLLASRFDDILDSIYASANRIFLYQVQPTKAMIELTDVIIRSAKELNTAMIHLRTMKNIDILEKCRLEVNRLENAADDILNKTLAELFKGTDAVDIMKHKEIIDFLELASDKCEDVANVIGDILVRHR
jgi:hypothetical protein